MKKFQGTRGKWKIVKKGNTVQSLSIETESGEKICHGISPKRTYDADLIVDAGNVATKTGSFPSQLLNEHQSMLIDKFNLQKETDKIKKVMFELLKVIDDSDGINGYNSNGDVATWSEFDDIITPIKEFVAGKK